MISGKLGSSESLMITANRIKEILSSRSNSPEEACKTMFTMLNLWYSSPTDRPCRKEPFGISKEFQMAASTEHPTRLLSEGLKI
jgi:hypothetical protein